MTDESDEKTYSISYRTINTSDVLDITTKEIDVAAENEVAAINSLRASVISEGGKNIRIEKIYSNNSVGVPSPKKNKRTIWGWVGLGLFVIVNIVRLLQKMT